MKVQFKNGENSYECSEPVEQKLFKSGTAIGWVIMFHISDEITSSEIDNIIKPETISELVFTKDDEEQTTFSVFNYSVITSCVIRYKEEKTIAELQFTKTN